MNVGEKVSSKKFHIIKNIALVTQLGFSMALPIVAGVYFGNWLDKRFGTQPFLLITCLIVFSISSFINLFKLTGVKKKKKGEEVGEATKDTTERIDGEGKQ